MSNTATLATVPASTIAAETDLFGAPLATVARAHVTSTIVSRTDATKVLGRKLTFDFKSLADFKAALAGNKDLKSAEKKKMRQEFLNADAIKQRRMLGVAALTSAYEADEFAPAGRVPDTMELRANGTLKLISVEKFLGKDKSETPTQKIARLERELREARAAKVEVKTTEAETLPVEAEVPAIEGEPAMEG